MVPLDSLAQALVVLGVQISWSEHHLLSELPLTLQCRHAHIETSRKGVLRLQAVHVSGACSGGVERRELPQAAQLAWVCCTGSHDLRPRQLQTH